MFGYNRHVGLRETKKLQTRQVIAAELGVDDVDARVAANAIVGVNWQFFRSARAQALAGKHGPAAARRLRAELERAYDLLEHGLGRLEQAT